MHIFMVSGVRVIFIAGILLFLLKQKTVFSQEQQLILSQKEYTDKVHAIWTAQMAGAIMGWPFEHKPAATQWVRTFNHKVDHVPVDDDWYYEMVAVRAFEKYGTGMTVAQLGRQWLENSAGTWGSSEQAHILMTKGINPPETGHPRYNKLWFTIGPQFSADVYGALSPGMPNVAAAMAREYGHLNGYAEAVDGGVFVAGMVSLGFYEKDTKTIVRKAASLIDVQSPYRQCLDMLISLADQKKSAREIFDAIEDRWHLEYPATNNAVANGGIVAACVWFGEGDFLKTVNLAFQAADFSDADCNAANAAAVVGAMHGMKGIPEDLIAAMGDSVKGTKMGKVVLTPAVSESISGLAMRTADIGEMILQKNGAAIKDGFITIKMGEPVTLPAELFKLSDLTKYWNPDWTLERAGFGGAGGGMGGIRGITCLENEVLATYPRDEVRGTVLRRTLKVAKEATLSFEAGADAGRAWELNVYVNNKRAVKQIIEGKDGKERQWYTIKTDLSPFNGKTVHIRLYQRVLLPAKRLGTHIGKTFR